MLSHREPTPRPFNHFVQSVGALDHSPMTVQILAVANEVRPDKLVQANYFVMVAVMGFFLIDW